MSEENRDALSVVLEHLYCWNMKDLEGFTSFLADNVVNEFVGPKGTTIQGKSMLKNLCQPLFADPKNTISIWRYVVDGNQVAVACVREGTDPKTGEVKLVDEADVFEVSDGKIQKVTSYIFEERFF